ncbi:MAG: PQQ-binding-like beta-propeller repeat protein [Roseibacillus sp.]|nr:PQQ-binding-like beta-propeller repeat protein [Roseibacillus sp.]
MRPFLLALMTMSMSSLAEDWPQYLGTGRDAVWREQEVELDFAKRAPRLVWSVAVGSGYAGPSVAKGRVFVMDRQAKPYVTEKLKPGSNVNFARGRIPGWERILCLDESSGEVIWEHSYRADYSSVYPYAIGPRTTPLVHDGMVYTLGAEGHLHACTVDGGQLVWHRNILKDYDLETPLWGTAGHPIVDGDLLICPVGGQGSTVVAFDRGTGQEKWKALNAREAGYGTPVIETINGHRQLLVWDAENLNGLDPGTGAVHWSVPFKPEYGMAIGAPRVWKDLVFVMGYNNKSGAVRVAPDGKSARLAWGRNLRKGVAGVMNTAWTRGGYIYSGGQRGFFRCVKMETGERIWETRAPLLKADGSGRGPWPHAFTVHHEPSGHTLIFNDHGEMISARLLPEGYREIARTRIIDPTHTVAGRLLVWSHPALANRRVYCRNDREIRCWDLGPEGRP